MRILILSHGLPCHRAGGLERATWTAARGLAERDHDVDILTTPPESYPEAIVSSQRQIDAKSAAAPGFVWDNVDRVSVRFLAGAPGRPGPAFWRSAARETWRRWNLPVGHAERPDVVYAVDTAAMFLRRVPFVLQLHGTLFSETTLHSGFSAHRDQFSLFRAILRYKARIFSWPWFGPMLRRAAQVIVDSQFIADLVTGNRSGAIELLPLALEADWAEALRCLGQSHLDDAALWKDSDYSADRPLRLLTVGRAARIKGHEAMARAIAELTAVDSGVSQDDGSEIAPGALVWEIAGPPSHVGSDCPSFADLEKSGTIKQLGLLEQSELAEAYGRADYLLNLEYNQPAFGLVALEALQAACAPIVSDRGALPEVLGLAVKPGYTDAEAVENGDPFPPGCVLPAGDSYALAKLLLRLYRSGTSCSQAMGRSAMKRADHYSQKDYIDGLEAVLKRRGRED